MEAVASGNPAAEDDQEQSWGRGGYGLAHGMVHMGRAIYKTVQKGSPAHFQNSKQRKKTTNLLYLFQLFRLKTEV